MVENIFEWILWALHPSKEKKTTWKAIKLSEPEKMRFCNLKTIYLNTQYWLNSRAPFQIQWLSLQGWDQNSNSSVSDGSHREVSFRIIGAFFLILHFKYASLQISDCCYQVVKVKMYVNYNLFLRTLLSC